MKCFLAVQSRLIHCIRLTLAERIRTLRTTTRHWILQSWIAPTTIAGKSQNTPFQRIIQPVTAMSVGIWPYLCNFHLRSLLTAGCTDRIHREPQSQSRKTPFDRLYSLGMKQTHGLPHCRTLDSRWQSPHPGYRISEYLEALGPSILTLRITISGGAV
jgi:hypothetical protein